MSARKMKGAWWVDFRFKGERIRKKSPIDTKRGAEEYERQLRQELFTGPIAERKVLPFDEWFRGRFWREWVIARKNKPSEVQAKESIYKNHLAAAFGHRRLDQIGPAEIADFRAALIERDPPLSDKRINNILAVLSKALRYAVEVKELASAPKVGLFLVERSPIESWEFDQYGLILASAKAYGPEWYAAVALAGEAGLRVGEIKELRWQEDVDLVAETITISRQIREEIVGTPKGRTRRTIPITTTLRDALWGLPGVREGLVLRNPDGSYKTDNQARYALDEITLGAGLEPRGWHRLRHTFGTHAALCGVNPWRLQAWMGHKRIEETMRYVHVAGEHARPLTPQIITAGSRESDPDRRIVAMLGARAEITPQAKGAAAFGHPVGNHVGGYRGKESDIR
jgi:integrase